MRKMRPGSSNCIPIHIDTLTTLDSKKRIIDAFQVECEKQKLVCTIDQYALYSFCIGQPYCLQMRWLNQDVDKEKALEEEKRQRWALIDMIERVRKERVEKEQLEEKKKLEKMEKLNKLGMIGMETDDEESDYGEDEDEGGKWARG
jgi:hypothetical protein